MGSDVIVARPTSLAAQLSSFVPLVVAVLAGLLVTGWHWQGLFWGSLVCLLYRFFVVRRYLLADNRRGHHALRMGDFREALEAFQASGRAWERRRTLDRFRWILLGEAGRFLHLDLSIYNQAYCLVRMERITEAQTLLEAMLAKDPHNVLASSLKSVIDAVKAGVKGETSGSDTSDSQ